MNVLVTGANGQLGSVIRTLAKDTHDKYIFTDVNQVEGVETSYLDITDIEAIRAIINIHTIDAIVNCAAYSNVDAAETNEPLAEKLNADAPENLAKAIKEVNGLLIHISTYYVFGAEPYNTPCKEDQQGTPTGVYGLTKLHGEQKIIATGCNHVIIRTAWLYSEFGNNFCKTMMNLTATKSELKVVFDQVGTPTYAWDLAKVILVILKDYVNSVISNEDEVRDEKSYACHPEERSDAVISYKNTGIYHYSNEGVCSWYDFAKMIAEYSGNTTCKINPCYSCDFPSPVRRPSYSVLDKSKIKSVFGVEVPYWTDSLKKCINKLKNTTQ